MENINLLFLLKIFTFLLLTWTYLPYNDLGIFDMSIENKYGNENSLNISIIRLLAKHEIQREIKYPKHRENMLHNKMDASIKNKSENAAAHGLYLKKGESNDLDTYKKEYKKRYSRRMGLGKLDCYLEKKIFDKFDNVCEFRRNMHSSKKSIEKKILKKYGIGPLLFALLPLLGCIVPIYFYETLWKRKLCPYLYENEHGINVNKPGHFFYGYKTTGEISRTTWGLIEGVNSLFSMTLCIIVFTVCVYIVIKVMKYIKLKEGKSKMRLNEYFR